jgi:hypothetical protein
LIDSSIPAKYDKNVIYILNGMTLCIPLDSIN